MAAGTEWRVWLPFPPSVNNLFTQGMVRGKVRRFPSKRYKAWRRAAAWRIAAARLRPWSEPVDIELALIAPDRRHRDASNHVKAVEDALVEARMLAGDDARYVRSVRPFWAGAPSRATAGVVVTLRAAEAGRRTQEQARSGVDGYLEPVEVGA